MQEIATGVAETDKLIGAIATAMEQQQATVADINENVGELNLGIGQSNATAAEEITATMLDLSRLAERTRVRGRRVREGVGLTAVTAGHLACSVPCLPPSAGEGGPKGRKGVMRPLFRSRAADVSTKPPFRRYAPPSPADGGRQT